MPPSPVSVSAHHGLRPQRVLTWWLVPPLAAWALLASLYLDHAPAALRWSLALLWLALAVVVPWRRARPDGRRWAGLALAAWLLFLGGWLLQAPRQDRTWADDVARLLQPQVSGSRVVLHNVRNFDWRSDTDYSARWETRQYDLDQLRGVDLAMSYWMGPAIAHTLLSFEFADGQRVVLSLEIRKERGESFSALGGFFRQFEKVLVAADERDILRVRTNVRGEDMQLYRLNMPPAAVRALFLAYLDEADALRAAPSFYNTLTSNCTTVVFDLARTLDPGLPLDWRLLLSGYFDRYAYELGGLAPGLDFPTLRDRGNVTARARASQDRDDFSERIRQGVPGARAP
jgi:hypothetical protein